MSFINIPPPPCFRYGVVCSIDWEVEVASNQGGFEQRNQVWNNPLRPYDASYAVKTVSDFQDVRNHFHMMRGRTHSFPYKDPVDFSASVDNGFVYPLLGAVDKYFLVKRYGIEPYQYERQIHRMMENSESIYSDGAPLVKGTAPGNYEIDLSTGLVTLHPLQSRDILSHNGDSTGGGHIIVVDSAFSPNVSIGDFVSIVDVTGTAASVLNNKRLVVLMVSGDQITLDADTAGLTASGGTAELFPEPDSLTWSGDFWTEVRYNMRGLAAQVINRRDDDELLLSADSILLMEVRHEEDYDTDPKPPGPGPDPDPDGQVRDIVYQGAVYPDQQPDTYIVIVVPPYDPEPIVGDSLFLTGITGVNAALLNGNAFPLTGVSPYAGPETGGADGTLCFLNVVGAVFDFVPISFGGTAEVVPA